MSTALMVPDIVCVRCADPRRQLLARTKKGHLCGQCWHELGMPGAPEATAEEAHAAEVAALARMARRGGADLSRVRNGKA